MDAKRRREIETNCKKLRAGPLIIGYGSAYIQDCEQLLAEIDRLTAELKTEQSAYAKSLEDCDTYKRAAEQAQATNKVLKINGNILGKQKHELEAEIVTLKGGVEVVLHRVYDVTFISLNDGVNPSLKISGNPYGVEHHEIRRARIVLLDDK